jgi:hypothetical protein
MLSWAQLHNTVQRNAPNPTHLEHATAHDAVRAGGLLSGALFQYPGAIIMTAVGVFAANLLANPSGILAGVASGVRVPLAVCRPGQQL